MCFVNTHTRCSPPVQPAVYLHKLSSHFKVTFPPVGWGSRNWCGLLPRFSGGRWDVFRWSSLGRRFHRFAVKTQTRPGRRCQGEVGRRRGGQFAAVPEEGWAESGGNAARSYPLGVGGHSITDRRCSPGGGTSAGTTDSWTASERGGTDRVSLEAPLWPCEEVVHLFPFYKDRD